MERDGKISDLTSRAERLETESEMFQVRFDSDLTQCCLTQFCSENSQETEAERADEEYKDTVVIVNIIADHNCDSHHCLCSPHQ